MVFIIPPRSEVGYLDSEIANEGQKVSALSDGQPEGWSPPPQLASVPDWSRIKSIARYFNRSGFKPYPAWLYHPTEPPRVVNDADEAAKLGVCYRRPTDDERQRYGDKDVWDWTAESKWRPTPHGKPKFDPQNPGLGKTYIANTNPQVAQHALVEALIPQVAAAVAAAMQGTGGPAAPVGVKKDEWDEFLAFKAWQKTQETVTKVASEITAEDAGGGTNALADPEAELAFWKGEAIAKNVRIDGRWSLERIKAEVEKA